MIIIDDFLSEENFAKVLDIAKQTRKTPEIPGCDHREEFDHVNFDQSHFWYIQGVDKIVCQELVDRGYFDPMLMKQIQMMVRYHITKAPYASIWHRDRVADWDGDEVDFIGLTLFLNEWDTNNGGLYIYKEDKNSDTGHFVAPKPNRFIFNPKDYYHGVTQIRVPDVERHSFQMFISSRFCKV